MEQGATGINSSVPTASLTGRIQFFYCRYEHLLTVLLCCILYRERPTPSCFSAPSNGPSRRSLVRRTDGYEPRAPGALYCNFYRLRFVRLPAWLVARGGGAVPRATLRSLEPHSPSEVPCTAHAFAAIEGVANPRIRGVYRAPRVPRSRFARQRSAWDSERAAPQQVPNKLLVGVRRAADGPRHRVSPRPG